MTFIGKILVIVIMAVALLFLGISTVALSTAKNWVGVSPVGLIPAEKAKVTELGTRLKNAKAQAEAAKKALDDTKAQFDQMAKQLQNQITTLQDDNARNLTQITTVRGQLGNAQETAKSTLEQVEAKRQQINQLRVEKSAVEKQASEFKLHEAELTDRIREVERILDTVTKNNSDLRERVNKRK
jgi:chromosome segregation ATPase